MNELKNIGKTGRNVTFLVCGQIEENGYIKTIDVLRSIKHRFPDSSVVLSTWEGENTDDFKALCDEIILNKRIKCHYKYYIDGYAENDPRFNSVNLQRKLAFEGLKRVSTDWCAKTRTDFYFMSNQILKEYIGGRKKYKIRSEGYQCVFKERVLVYEYYTQNTRKHNGYFPCAISDCLQMGLTSDLKKLWNDKTVPDEDLNFFNINKSLDAENIYHFNHRYICEENFFLKFIEDYPWFPIPQSYADRSNPEYVIMFEKIIAGNFLVRGGG